MIIDQLEKQLNFTNTEKKLAEFILDNLKEIPSLSVRNLAKKSYTSKSSIIRFCQKLNFSGYNEFQNKLVGEIDEITRIALLLEKEPVHQDTSLSEIFKVMPNIYMNAINSANLTIDEDSFKKIIKNIRNSTTLDIYGSGITYTCATTAKFKLRTLGINCNTYSGINEHYIRSAIHNEENKVAIILSFTGANKTMIDIARYLKASGVYVIGIGGNETQALKNICDEYIEIITQQLILSMEVVAPFIEITYIFDLLFTSLLVADFEKNVDIAVDVINFKKAFI